eukprot:TRINITY_DN2654_c0_g1_i1.p1 TRINITY_DN2654_c0_g1~~TRINITY_DN2654_c0_g1_i1.p1  ORF type:complete len:620 (-),score=190.89 TRINITY_DN2654_c0_g1_i1:35-1894(-)
MEDVWDENFDEDGGGGYQDEKEDNGYFSEKLEQKWSVATGETSNKEAVAIISGKCIVNDVSFRLEDQFEGESIGPPLLIVRCVHIQPGEPHQSIKFRCKEEMYRAEWTPEARPIPDFEFPLGSPAFPTISDVVQGSILIQVHISNPSGLLQVQEHHLDITTLEAKSFNSLLSFCGVFLIDPEDGVFLPAPENSEQLREFVDDGFREVELQVGVAVMLELLPTGFSFPVPTVNLKTTKSARLNRRALGTSRKALSRSSSGASRTRRMGTSNSVSRIRKVGTKGHGTTTIANGSNKMRLTSASPIRPKVIHAPDTTQKTLQLRNDAALRRRAQQAKDLDLENKRQMERRTKRAKAIVPSKGGQIRRRTSAVKTAAEKRVQEENRRLKMRLSKIKRKPIVIAAPPISARKSIYKKEEEDENTIKEIRSTIDEKRDHINKLKEAIKLQKTRFRALEKKFQAARKQHDSSSSRRSINGGSSVKTPLRSTNPRSIRASQYAFEKNNQMSSKSSLSLGMNSVNNVDSNVAENTMENVHQLLSISKLMGKLDEDTNATDKIKIRNLIGKVNALRERMQEVNHQVKENKSNTAKLESVEKRMERTLARLRWQNMTEEKKNELSETREY